MLRHPSYGKHGVKKSYVDTTFLKLSGGTMTSALYMKTTLQVTLDEALNVKTVTAYFVQIRNPYVNTRFNMVNHKIINLGDPTSNKDATNKAYVDTNFLKLSGGDITGMVSKDTQSTMFDKSLLNYEEAKFWFVEKGNPHVRVRFNMADNKIIILGDPTDDKDAIKMLFLEQEVQKSHIKPSHYNNEFKYLMANKLQWTDLLEDSCDISKIDNLMPHESNYHQYNHKVLFTTIRKDQKGGYTYKMGIQCYPLDKDKDDTLCIEILNLDYQLWHKSVATTDKTTSHGLTIDGVVLQKFSHRYTNNNGSVEYMYYIKTIVNFQKTAPDPLYSLRLYVDIPQTGNDLGTYSANWTKKWIIAYGVYGKTSSIDHQKTYDYHTAFDIKPTKVIYNVDLDRN